MVGHAGWSSVQVTVRWWEAIGMKITIRYFDGCPHWQMAEDKLNQIASKGLDAQIDHELVSTAEEAERLRVRRLPDDPDRRSGPLPR